MHLKTRGWETWFKGRVRGKNSFPALGRHTKVNTLSLNWFLLAHCKVMWLILKDSVYNLQGFSTRTKLRSFFLPFREN